MFDAQVRGRGVSTIDRSAAEGMKPWVVITRPSGLVCTPIVPAGRMTPSTLWVETAIGPVSAFGNTSVRAPELDSNVGAIALDHTPYVLAAVRFAQRGFALSRGPKS